MKQPIIGVGTTVFIVESNQVITAAKILHRRGEFYIIRTGNDGRIRVRRSRLFLSQEEAEAKLPHNPKSRQNKYCSPYDYGA